MHDGGCPRTSQFSVSARASSIGKVSVINFGFCQVDMHVSSFAHGPHQVAFVLKSPLVIARRYQVITHVRDCHDEAQGSSRVHGKPTESHFRRLEIWTTDGSESRTPYVIPKRRRVSASSSPSAVVDT